MTNQDDTLKKDDNLNTSEEHIKPTDLQDEIDEILMEHIDTCMDNGFELEGEAHQAIKAKFTSLIEREKKKVIETVEANKNNPNLTPARREVANDMINHILDQLKGDSDEAK